MIQSHESGLKMCRLLCSTNGRLFIFATAFITTKFSLVDFCVCDRNLEDELRRREAGPVASLDEKSTNAAAHRTSAARFLLCRVILDEFIFSKGSLGSKLKLCFYLK